MDTSAWVEYFRDGEPSVIRHLEQCLDQDLVAIGEQAAQNYRRLRSLGVTVRKTIHVIIGTFCAKNGFPLVHYDRDFDLMAKHIGLAVRAL